MPACVKLGRSESHEKRDLRGRASAVRSGSSQEAECRKQAAENARKQAEDAICYELSERERELVEELNKSTLY